MSSIYIQYLNKYDLFTCQKMSVFKALNFQETTKQDWAEFCGDSKNSLLSMQTEEFQLGPSKHERTQQNCSRTH